MPIFIFIISLVRNSGLIVTCAKVSIRSLNLSILNNLMIMPEFAPNIFRTEAMDCGRLPPDLPLAGRWTPPLQGQQVAPQPSSAHAGLPFRHPETIHESKQPECGSFPGEGHYDISVCVYQKLLRGMLGVNVSGFIIHHMRRQTVPGTHRVMA